MFDTAKNNEQTAPSQNEPQLDFLLTSSDVAVRVGEKSGYEVDGYAFKYYDPIIFERTASTAQVVLVVI